MKKTIILAILVSLATSTMAQKQDTVIVPLANTSQVIFTMKDRKDLETLKNYNFQALFEDILAKIEKADTAKLPGTDTTIQVTEKEEDWGNHHYNSDNYDNNDSDDEWTDNHGKKRHSKSDRRTRQSFSFDFGTNNFLSNGKFPDSNDEQYAVRPWGSWYIGLNSIQRTRLAQKFFLEWGGGVSWYNLKFQDEHTLMVKDGDATTFVVDPRAVNTDYDFIKSKLTVCYVNASLVPVLDFSDRNRKNRMWGGHGDAFRIGLGPYIGYKIDSYSKQVFEELGDKKKEHNHDSFYIQNMRYGVRLQMGYRGTDFFVNYDLNEMFTKGKGPNVNAFSFGITL